MTRQDKIDGLGWLAFAIAVMLIVSLIGPRQ
jgi:hypothetical protein